MPCIVRSGYCATRVNIRTELTSWLVAGPIPRVHVHIRKGIARGEKLFKVRRQSKNSRLGGRLNSQSQ